MKTKIILSGLIFCATPQIANSQNIIQQDAETIVISATKNPKPIETIAASIKIIDGQMIEQKQSIQLIDALNNVSGLSFSRNGGYGQTTSIFIRGGESHDTLLLYDGVAVIEPSLPAGNFDYSSVTISEVEKIEILKGPQSVLYGSDAIGGVINIISKRPKNPIESSFNLEIGSHETNLLRASVAGKISGFTYSLAAHNFQTEGISAKSKTIGGIENDGAINQGVNIGAAYAFNDNFGINLRANHVQGKTEFDGFPAPFYSFSDTEEYNKIKQTNGFLGINLKSLGGKLKSEIMVKSLQSDRRNFDPILSPEVTYIATSQSKTLEYLGNLNLSEKTDLVFGVLTNNQDYSARSPASWDPDPIASHAKASIDSYYSELQFENQNGIFFTFGGRLDKHSSFGDETTFRTSLSYAPNGSKSRFHINYGEGFKAPSLFQIYSDYGNLNLKPEIANAIEMGLSHKIAKNWQFSLIGFKRQSENQIDFFSCFGSSAPLCVARPFGYYENIKTAQIEGIEIETNFKANKISIDANYSIIDAENQTIGSPNFGKQLARRPKNSANLEIIYDWTQRFNTAITYNYIGERYDDAGNQNRLKQYELVSLRANWRLNENYEIYGRVENLFDRKYEIIRNYGIMPQSMNIGLRAKF